MYDMYALMMDRMLRDEQMRRYAAGAGRPVPALRGHRRRARRHAT